MSRPRATWGGQLKTGLDMQKFLAAIAALGVAVGMSTVAQANIVYAINQSSTTPEVPGELSPLSDTISGTITTDGTIGVLQSNNVLSYNLQINDNLRPDFDVDLTPTNSGIVEDLGNGLSASATGLSFDFSDDGAVFAIQGTSFGFFSGFQYFCFQATSGPCAAGETIVPDFFSVDGVSVTGLSGPLPLSGVPEPTTWAMLLLGFGGLGAVMRSRRRMATVPTWHG
jgi:PEP-CTERM motif